MGANLQVKNLHQEEKLVAYSPITRQRSRMQMLLYALFTLSTFAQLTPTLKQYENTFVAQFDATMEADTGYRPLVANFLRLAFHDCVGTCDGCLNMDNPHHLGLQLSIDTLSPMVDQWKADTQLSRADLFAFAAYTAAKYAFGPGVILDFDYAYGREDCEVTLGLDPETFDFTTQDSAAHELEAFPDSHDSPFEFMTERFGFTDEMTTAIMGVHVLGRMSLENSGHSGLWVNTPCELDGEFYRDMIDIPWEQESSVSQTFGTRQQWRRDGNNNDDQTFLNADMALIVNFDHTDGLVNDDDCRNNHNQCPDASTLNVASSFQNDDTFVAAFKSAFLSLLSNGFSLTTVCEEETCDAMVRMITAPNAMFCQEQGGNGKGAGPDGGKGNGPPPSSSDSSDSSEEDDSAEDTPGKGNGPPPPGGKGAGKGRGRRLLKQM